MIITKSHSKRSQIIITLRTKTIIIHVYGLGCRGLIRLVYVLLLNVPSVSSPNTNVSFREMARLIARNSLRHVRLSRIGQSFWPIFGSNLPLIATETKSAFLKYMILCVSQKKSPQMLHDGKYKKY